MHQVCTAEKDLGSRLIHRTTRLTTLTEEGRAFLGCARVPGGRHAGSMDFPGRRRRGDRQARGAEELRARTLMPVLRDFPLVSTQALWAIYPSSRVLAPKVRVFIDWLVERFGPTPYWDEGLPP